MSPAGPLVLMCFQLKFKSLTNNFQARPNLLLCGYIKVLVPGMYQLY